jgi:peptide deformylase
MALRKIVYDNDPFLRKQSREVREITDRIRELVDDMWETMYASNGIGLAAPQVGVLRRVAVIDITLPKEPEVSEAAEKEADENEADENKAEVSEAVENDADENEADENKADVSEADENEAVESAAAADGDSGITAEEKLSGNTGGNDSDSETETETETFKYVLINPEVVETSGEIVTDKEGCLSVPGRVGVVGRPEYVKVRALDIDGNSFEVEGKGLPARALLHELDHLNGVIYTDIAESIESSEPNEPEKEAGPSE